MIVERSPGRWFVLSSKGNDWYFVKKSGEHYTCNCDGGVFGKPCKHVREVKSA